MLQKLKKGDKIALIAPSGMIQDVSLIEKGVKLFKNAGYELIPFPTCNKKYITFAGTEEEKINDIKSAFKNKEIKAILCARGGYGAIKLLDKINYKIIKNNPKIFCGLSDITTLLLYINKKCNIPTFHSSMLSQLLNNGNIEDFIKTVNMEKTEILPNKNFVSINAKETKGMLFGGNLATISALVAKQDFIPNKKIILFLEDLNEPVYKIDRMIQTIFRSKKLKKQVSALVIGEFTGISWEDIEYIFNDLSKEVKIPIFYGYNISHSENNECVPIGINSSIDKDGKITLKIK